MVAAEQTLPASSQAGCRVSLCVSFVLHAAAIALLITAQGSLQHLSPLEEPPSVPVVFEHMADEMPGPVAAATPTIPTKAAQPAPTLSAPLSPRLAPLTKVVHAATKPALPVAGADMGREPSAAGGADNTAIAPASAHPVPAYNPRGPTIGVREQAHPAPPYPVMARKLHQQGRVVVRVVVGFKGQLMSVAIESSSGYSSLDEAALTAVKSWSFYPATEDGVAVRAMADIPVVFRLEGM